MVSHSEEVPKREKEIRELCGTTHLGSHLVELGIALGPGRGERGIRSRGEGPEPWQ